MQPSRHSMRSSSGMAVLALESSSTAVWASTRRLVWAQALTRCRGPNPRPRSWEPRTLLPSMGTTWPLVMAKVSCTQSRKPSSNRAASSRAKTRPSVSCEGIPWGSVRRSQSSLSWPKRAMNETVGAADDRQHRQHQDVRQVVQLGAVDPRILQAVQGLDQGRRHRAVHEGTLRRLNPEPPIVATPQLTRCSPNLDAIALACLPTPVCAGARIAGPSGRPHGSGGDIQTSLDLDLC